MNIDELEQKLRDRNRLRSEAGLPRLDVDQELDKQRQLAIEGAYENFLFSHLEPYLNELPLPINMDEAKVRQISGLRIRAEHEPRIKEEWKDKLQDGSWVEWKD